MAAQTVGFESQLEVLGPVLALATPHVLIVEPLRITGSPAGYDETGVGASLHHLRLLETRRFFSQLSAR